jgi:hypothetical protein
MLLMYVFHVEFVSGGRLVGFGSGNIPARFLRESSGYRPRFHRTLASSVVQYVGPGDSALWNSHMPGIKVPRYEEAKVAIS